MESEALHHHSLPRTGGDNGPPLVVNLQHQAGGLLFGESEKLPEYEHDICHEVDWIVPYHDVPRTIQIDLDAAKLIVAWSGRHIRHVTQSSGQRFRDAHCSGTFFVDPDLEILTSYPPLAPELHRRELAAPQHAGDNKGGDIHVLTDVRHGQPLLGDIDFYPIH